MLVERDSLADVLVSDPEADTYHGAAYVLLLLPSGSVKDVVLLTAATSNLTMAFPTGAQTFSSTSLRTCAPAVPQSHNPQQHIHVLQQVSIT